MSLKKFSRRNLKFLFNFFYLETLKFRLAILLTTSNSFAKKNTQKHTKTLSSFLIRPKTNEQLCIIKSNLLLSLRHGMAFCSSTFNQHIKRQFINLSFSHAKKRKVLACFSEKRLRISWMNFKIPVRISFAIATHNFEFAFAGFLTVVEWVIMFCNFQWGWTVFFYYEKNLRKFVKNIWNLN